MSSDIVSVRILGGFRLFLQFEDGVEGEVDISEVVPFDGVFARLKDPCEFEKVYVDHEWGTICWPGNLDLAPEPLYEKLTSTRASRTYETNDAQSEHCALADSRQERPDAWNGPAQSLSQAKPSRNP